MQRWSTSPGLEEQKSEGKKYLFNWCLDKTEQKLQNIKNSEQLNYISADGCVQQPTAWFMTP